MVDVPKSCEAILWSPRLALHISHWVPPLGILISTSSQNIHLLFSCSVTSNSFRPYGLNHIRLPCPSPSLSLLTLMPIESVMPSSHPDIYIGTHFSGCSVTYLQSCPCLLFSQSLQWAACVIIHRLIPDSSLVADWLLIDSTSALSYLLRIPHPLPQLL